MVKNAVRIIVMSVFKLNEPMVNKLLSDVPFVNFFCHLACQLRDKIVEIDALHNPQNKGKGGYEKGAKADIDHDKIEDECDDLVDLL